MDLLAGIESRRARRWHARIARKMPRPGQPTLTDTFAAFMDQGWPRRTPVVLGAGLLIQEGDDRHITDWSFETRWMDVGGSYCDDDLWDFLTAYYPVVRL